MTTLREKIIEAGYNTIREFICGGGGAYPVPVEMINVPNIEINKVVATQISSQVANAGISNQVASSQVDEQTANEQITSNTGNKC